MARLVTCGYETGDANEFGASTVGSFATLAVVTATPTPRLGGAYCLKISFSNAGWNPTYKTFSLPSALTDVWVRCGFYPHGGGTNAECPILGFSDSASVNQACVTYSSADNQFRARQGSSTGATLLATSTTSGGYAQDAWHLLEARWQGTSTTAGVMEVWVDGVRVINFSGDNTATANVNIQSVWFGAGTASNTQLAQYYAFDDIAINDTTGTINNGRIGEGRVVLLAPNGAGSSTGLNRGGTDTGANWSQVSEIPPSMAQYVTSATVASRDLYALADLPALSNQVNAIDVVSYSQMSDASAGSIGLTIRNAAGTVSEATAQAISSGVGYYRATFERDPAGAVWTPSAVNSLEAGVTVR